MTACNETGSGHLEARQAITESSDVLKLVDIPRFQKANRHPLHRGISK